MELCLVFLAGHRGLCSLGFSMSIEIFNPVFYPNYSDSLIFVKTPGIGKLLTVRINLFASVCSIFCCHFQFFILDAYILR
ncbi:hypothetical protein A4A49_59946 [Nicotiana attenuata]|uniref:Uncharacterized protein n=1 Tax=Nicotiana attenuata TaxID=49451 RepID=A0A1J6IP62_NICAT|nr:hypothetical protein A4A49_59946 [Nicotiana attenuata]